MLLGLWPFRLLLSPDEGSGGGGNGDGDPDKDKGDGDPDGSDKDKESNGDKDNGDEEEDPYKGLSAAQLKARLADKENLVGKLRKESKGRRIKLEKVEKAAAEKKKAEMSDLEKSQARVKELEGKQGDLEAKIKTGKLQTAIERAATKLEFERPDFAYKLIDLELVEVQDDGEITGIDKALKKLAKDAPGLIKKGKKPDLESEETGTGKDLKLDEAEIRSEFGLKPAIQTDKE